LQGESDAFRVLGCVCCVQVCGQGIPGEGPAGDWAFEYAVVGQDLDVVAQGCVACGGEGAGESCGGVEGEYEGCAGDQASLWLGVCFAGLVADEQLISVPDVVCVVVWACCGLGGLIVVVGVGIGKVGGCLVGSGS